MKKIIINLTIFILISLFAVAGYFIFKKDKLPASDNKLASIVGKTILRKGIIEKNSDGIVEKVDGYITEIFPDKITVNFLDGVQDISYNNNTFYYFLYSDRPSGEKVVRLNDPSEYFKPGKFVSVYCNIMPREEEIPTAKSIIIFEKE